MIAKILAVLQQPQVYSFIIYVLISILTFIVGKIKNKNLKKLVEILPEAMKYSEDIGGDPKTKLKNAISYIRKQIKLLSKNAIILAIENGITISKEINADKTTQEKNAVVESRISTGGK